MFQWMRSPNFLQQCLLHMAFTSTMCLAMGLADATDIFELCIHQLLHDLQGVLNIADDILVFGGTKEEFNSNVISFLD